MKLLLSVVAPEGADTAFAYIEIDAATAERILARRKAYLALDEKDPGLVTIDFFDSGIRWFKSTADEADIPGDVNDFDIADSFIDRVGDEAFVETGETPPDWLEQRTECDIMEVFKDGVSWRCYEKHTDIRVCTNTVPYDVFKKALKEA